MRLIFLTICLDAMPLIATHLPVFQRLNCDWHWYIAEGTAAPIKCTKWCAPIAPRLSRDGTSEYLKSIAGGRVTVFQNPQWPGKASMFNRMLQEIKRNAIAFQIDADELWLPHQIENIRCMMLSYRRPTRMDFRCRYFFGKDIIITSRGTYGDMDYEWKRVWAFEPGMQFSSHEPPVIRGDDKRVIGKDETEELGLVFDHYAYATRAQVEFKQIYYRYSGAVAAWDKLQLNQKWPTLLKNWLPWIKDETVVDKLYKS